MTIFVKRDAGQMIELDVVPSDTVAQIKEDIKDKESVPLEQQHLFYAGKRLDDEKRLADYSIHDESVLKLKVGQIMRIFVETCSGEKIELEVLPSDTIREIKSQIYEIKGIVSAQQ